MCVGATIPWARETTMSTHGIYRISRFSPSRFHFPLFRSRLAPSFWNVYLAFQKYRRYSNEWKSTNAIRERGPSNKNMEIEIRLQDMRAATRRIAIFEVNPKQTEPYDMSAPKIFEAFKIFFPDNYKTHRSQTWYTYLSILFQSTRIFSSATINFFQVIHRREFLIPNKKNQKDSYCAFGYRSD